MKKTEVFGALHSQDFGFKVGFVYCQVRTS